MKKLIALLLSLLLVFSLAIPAFAAEAQASDTGTASASGFSSVVEKLTALSERLISSLRDRIAEKEILTSAPEETFGRVLNLLAETYDSFGDVITVPVGTLSLGASGEETDGIRFEGDDDSALPEGTELTLYKLSDILKNYVFVRFEDAGALAATIADASVYDYTVYDGENGTVIIRVNILEHPELFNQAVFQKLVEKLYEKQGEEMLKHNDGSIDYLMSYEHIAGELALHALVYAAANEIIRVTGSHNATLFSLYNSAVIADLDYAESRIPAPLISFFGRVLINTFRFNIFRVFGLI